MPATGSERRSSAVAATMDTSRRLSASSDCSLPDRDQKCFQEHVETIPTRLPKLTSSKPAANPLQFIKVGPCDLYRSAQEQIRKVEEVKKIKEKRDEAEDWQSNLDNWKNSRRKRQEHIIERVVEVKKFELEEYDRNRKRSKTFNEMMEERTNRGRKVSLVVYKDDDDKDLRDLGIGANSGCTNDSSDDNDTQSMTGNEYAEESMRATIQPKDAYDGQDTSFTLQESQESQEFTYEQAIQSYVNFAETRVKSKNSSRNERQSVKEVNCTSRSEETLNDVGRKEKTPPPVAPKPRKYSLKLEVPITDKKNLGAEGNGCISDNTRKLSLPQVDVLKRREVFEKSLASKEHSSKNKPAELIDTKTVKERLSSLGINSSGVSNRIKSTETEIKTSRQLQLSNPKKQPSETYINANDGKLEQNGDNSFVGKGYRNDSEHLEESESELNACEMNGNNNSDNSLKEKTLNSTVDASTNNKLEIIANTHLKDEDYYRYDNGVSVNRRAVDDADQCWMHSDSTKNSRQKFHRSLDSLDKKCDDHIGSELLERVQSFEGLEHCNSVKDYPLSASSIEMLGSSSNGGDTDREDSGIHTADVSCSISQTDEAVEYVDPSTDISNSFSHLLLEKTVGNSDDHDVKCVVEEQEFSHFIPSSVKDPIGTADTSRISLETCTFCEREQASVSGASTDVSSQSVGSMECSDSTLLQTDKDNSSSLLDNSACTQAVNGDGCNYHQKPQLESDCCTEISNTSSVSAKDEGFLSDNGKEETGMQLVICAAAYEDSEMILLDPQTNSLKICFNSPENHHNPVSEIPMKTVSQPINNPENTEQEIMNSQQFSPLLLKFDSLDVHTLMELTEQSDTCCSEREDENAMKKLFNESNNAQTQSSLAQFNLESKTTSVKKIDDENVSGDTCVSGDNIVLTGTIKGNQCCEQADYIYPEETMSDMPEFSDRNSLLDANVSGSDCDNMVVAIAEVTQEQKKEQDEKEEGDVLVQKTEVNAVELEYGDGKCSTVLSACINTKDSPNGTNESKEEIQDPASDYTEVLRDLSNHENQKFLTSGLQINGKVTETMLNDRVCVTSYNELSDTVYEDHSVQKQSDVREDTVKSFLAAEIITKDIKNLRNPESPEVKSESFANSIAEVIESPIAETSQVIHQIPPLNLSSEIEILAGLTFPLGPVTAAEPPKEKPPPPPPPQSDSDDEHAQRGRGLQRIDSTKRIKKEIRRKRTNFLGIEGNADDSYLEAELKVAPPPDMTTFLMEEQRLQKQLYRQSICSESDSNLGETTDSRDSGVELEKGNPDDIWAPKPSSTPDVLSLEHSRQNSEIYANTSIASEDDEIAKKEREIIETLEKEEQWQHGHSPHNHEDNIGEELTEKLWQLEQDNLRLEWEKAQRRELEETVQRHEEEMRQKEREREFQRHEAMLQMERTRLEREAEIIPRHKDKLPQPQQWGNKGRLSLQDISVMRHSAPKNIAQFTSRSILPEHCQSMPDLQQKRPEQDWKQHSPPKVAASHHSQPTQQDWQEKENYSRSSWTPVFSPITQQKEFPASGTSHIQGQQMTRQTLQALSAVPRPRLIPTDNWIQAKRKPESKRGTFNSQHWLIQEAEQRRITEQQQRNAMASQKMPTSQLSQPLLWMHQQPQQKKPLPDSVINTLTQRVQNKADSKKYPNRTRAQDTQSREQIVGHNNVPRPNGNPATMNCDQTTEKMLSVSGKKKCSHCGEELGRGAAMIIESLRLFYHIDCFKCCVCHIQLGDGLMGTDVRVRNNKLHCHNCYSSEDGVKFSCV